MEVLHDEALLAAACTLHVALHATLRRFDTAVDAHAPHWWSGSPSLPSAVEAVEPAVEAVEPAVEAVEPAVEAEAVGEAETETAVDTQLRLLLEAEEQTNTVEEEEEGEDGVTRQGGVVIHSL
jgi:hypothetical protein